MTEEEKKLAVEKEQADAAAAKAKADAEANEPSELEKQLAAKDAELAKIRDERDNYKRGMLKAKGKPSEGKEGEDPIEDEDERTRRIFREEQMKTDEFRINTEKDQIIKQGLARIKELETAIKNRTQISTAGAGSSSDTKLEPKDPILSEEMIADFKKRGWDDAKIERYKKTYMKVR